MVGLERAWFTITISWAPPRLRHRGINSGPGTPAAAPGNRDAGDPRINTLAEPGHRVVCQRSGCGSACLVEGNPTRSPVRQPLPGAPAGVQTLPSINTVAEPDNRTGTTGSALPQRWLFRRELGLPSLFPGPPALRLQGSECSGLELLNPYRAAHRKCQGVVSHTNHTRLPALSPPPPAPSLTPAAAPE